MSVVVYKDGVLAADSKAYGGKYQISPGRKAKAWCLKDGSRLGVTSAIVGTSERFKDWLEAGGDPAAWQGDKPDMRAMLIKPNGELFLYEDGLFPSGPIQSAEHAIGSGADVARGAMAMGADAERAVRIASMFDPHCAAPVLIITPEAEEWRS